MTSGRWASQIATAEQGDLGEVEQPRLVTKDDVWPTLPATTTTPPSSKGDPDLLLMDVRGPDNGH